MRSIAIQNGDLVIKDKRLQIACDRQQVIQKIRGNLSIYKGELFYNSDVGIDRDTLFPDSKADDNNEMKQLAIVEALSDIEEIESIEEFEFEKRGRQLIVNLRIKIKDGSIVETGGVDIG